MSFISLPLGGSLPQACQGGSITIGNFDGVHVGHQALLAEAVRQAGRHSGPAVAVTLSPHPLKLIRPESFLPELTTLNERVELLLRYGAQHVIALETTPALLQLSAREFFEQIVVGRLQARSIVEGVNFGFGKNREGNVVLLQTLGREKNVEVVLIPPVEMQGKPVSSSRVRDELVAGNVVMARSLLGRSFRLSGVVKTGQKRGQTLGFPTANLEDVATLVPGDGVYAVRVELEGKTWQGAANLGPNPTFGEHARKIEVHLIGFWGDLYGKMLAVDFVERLRDTRPFGSVQELRAQLQDDVQRANEILGQE